MGSGNPALDAFGASDGAKSFRPEAGRQASEQRFQKNVWLP
jgi:hypothetical protein